MIPTGSRQSRFRCGGAAAAMLLAGGLVAQQSAAAEGDTIEATARPPVRYLEPAVPLGEESDFVPPPRASPAELELDPAFGERARSIERFNESIISAETSTGAWHNSLIEQLSALGALQQQQGDYPSALAAHERAVHVQRIHSGLHTVEQLPLIRRMIDSYIAMGDWAQADNYQNYLFFVQHKSYGNFDARLIPALADYAEWHLHAFTIGDGPSLAMRLSSAQMLFGAAARMVEAHFGREDQRYVEYLRGVARSAYLVASNQDLMRELSQAQFRSPQETLRDMLYWRFPIVPSGFKAGEDALLGILEQHQSADTAPERVAEASAQLADWYLLFDRRGDARDWYGKAWSSLEGAENAQESRQRLFGEIRQIPVYAFDNREWIIQNLGYVAVEEEVNQDFIDIQLDITRWGEVRNIETLSEASAETVSQHNWIRRRIRDSIFRPSLVDGEMVRVDDNELRYRYWY